MDCKEKVAHISPEDDRDHPLVEHLVGTATKASQMAKEFGCAEWGYLAGLWHDLGKYSEDFQNMIRLANHLDGQAARIESKSGRVDHSTAGGIYATKRFGLVGRILAYLISGHHTGLPDWHSETSGMAGLAQRILKKELLEKALSAGPPIDILELDIPKEKPMPGSDPALWIRMLFSCLVDADFLDTEAFFKPGKSLDRKGYPEVASLLPSFTQYMEGKLEGANDTPINKLRADILKRCIFKSADKPGIFTLTVPTGGGKTLSSLAFALHHAVKYGRRRIIYVIPYTSIIEQTADQFREIFGDVIVEHHSNIEVTDEKNEDSKNRLASENWDAPIVVTTSVQFFESLFASRTGRCRKLHNIANSVVVLDETQLLPPEFLHPILEVLQELKRSYGVTVVLSTATQPALEPHRSFDFNFSGISGMTEIMEDPRSLYASFKRVEVMLPDDFQASESWEVLASELKEHHTVLCIVNRRDDCRMLYTLLPEGTIHLSALMCGAHRSVALSRIKSRLEKGLETRVVSTQLVEAGVDIDFPVVYRALAGLDSLAQAAGRCNREGHLEKGIFKIFVPPSSIPSGHLRQAGEIGRRVLQEAVGDSFSPENFERYFKELYWLKGQEGLDKYGVLRDLAKDPGFRFSFRTAARKFRIIDDAKQAPVVVAYGKGAALVELLKKNGPDRWLLRKLQRYTVNLPRYIHDKLLEAGDILEVRPGICTQGHTSLYHPEVGFCADKSIVYGPDELLC